MKKLILLLLLSFFTVNAQQKKVLSQEQKVINKAKQIFQMYVETSFKDPYSYKLQKIWAKPNTIQSKTESLLFDLNLITERDTTSILYRKPEAKAEIKEALKSKNEILESYNKLSEKDKSNIVDYTVYIDAYGANSYGNKVLGRYMMKVGKNGEFLELPTLLE